MGLYYRELGAGLSVIILHGLFGSSDNWLTLMKRFADDFHVFTVDQRNHGRSFHDEAFEYGVMVEDLADFYREAGLEKAVIIGHSMGGKTAMQFSLDHPELVEKLIVVDIAPRYYPVRHDHIAEALCSLDLDRYTRREEIDNALAEKIDDPAIRQFLMKNIGRSSNGGLSWKINLPVITANLDNIGARISGPEPFKGPTLFIAGERSDYIQKKDEPGIRKLFPQVRIIYFENTGHWVHAESSDEFYNTVSGFIKNN